MDDFLCPNNTLCERPPCSPPVSSILSGSLFPTRKAASSPSSSDDGTPNDDKDPLSSQMWRLYTKAKDSLPNGTRLENLTWRMMAMKLNKKKKEEEEEEEAAMGREEAAPVSPPLEVTTPSLHTWSLSSPASSNESMPQEYPTHTTHTTTSNSDTTLLLDRFFDAMDINNSANLSSMTPTIHSRPRSAPKTACTNCRTETTPLWRRDPTGQPLCNACGLFLKLHGVVRPLSLKTNVIKKRIRSGSIQGTSASIPSASASASTSATTTTTKAAMNTSMHGVKGVCRNPVTMGPEPSIKRPRLAGPAAVVIAADGEDDVLWTHQPSDGFRNVLLAKQRQQQEEASSSSSTTLFGLTPEQWQQLILMQQTAPSLMNNNSTHTHTTSTSPSFITADWL